MCNISTSIPYTILGGGGFGIRKYSYYSFQIDSFHYNKDFLKLYSIQKKPTKKPTENLTVTIKEKL